MSLLFAILTVLVPASWAQDDGAADAASLADPDSSLQEAYQREFAFLAGLKRQLAQRRDQVVAKNAAEAAGVRSEIDALETKLLSLEDNAQLLREQLAAASENSPADEKDLVEATLAQARISLSDYGVEIPEAEPGKDWGPLVQQTFTEAVSLLDELGSVHTTEGEFFSKTGQATKGKLAWIGRVGVYGASPDAAGALAPAGEGKLKIWKDSGEDDARALVEGGRPERISLFIVESLTAQVDDGEGQTVFEHIDSGGAIAWVIMGLGAFGIVLVIIRAVMLYLSSGNTSDLEEEVAGFVKEGKYAQAITAAGERRGSAGRVLSSLVTNLQNGVDDVEDVVSEALLAESRRIQRFATVILVIAAVAPLLGLLGTVTGMISTFDVITKYGTGDPKMLSGGISTALVTTELGLVVAIPTLLLGNLLKGWGDGIESDIEHAALKVINVHKERQEAA